MSSHMVRVRRDRPYGPATEMRSTEYGERYHEDQVHFERAARCGCRLRCWRRDLRLRLLLGLCQHRVGMLILDHG
jgi:hypothetical protein